MPYTINNFNGSIFTSVADGVIDKQFSSSIYLVGKNVTGYGAYQNDNFLWLLQNFAGQAEPINKLQGQTWFDTSSGALKLKIYDGIEWKPLTTTLNTTTTPTSSLGDLWYTPTSNQIFLGIGSGTNWQLIGPEAVAGFGETKFTSGPLFDTTNRSHAAIRLFDDGQLLAVITTGSFNVRHTEDVYTAGIKTTIGGISFVPNIGVQTNYITAGVSTSSGTLTGNWTVDSLVSPLATITTVSSTIVSATTVTSSALTVSGYSYITSMFGSDISVGKIISPSLISTGLTSGSPYTQGVITGTWSLSPGSTLSSTYADLAEFYMADDTYSPGQVMQFGGSAEITLSTADMSTNVAGIISSNPAFILNGGSPGLCYALALAGRVFVYVSGDVNVGDMLVTDGKGGLRSESNTKPGTIVARAINSIVGGGMIEVQVARG